MKMSNLSVGFVICLFVAGFLSPAAADEYLTGIEWKEPPVVTPGENGSPPSDAIILFDGKDFSAWRGAENWKVENGVVISGKGNAFSKDSFGDCQFHIEWSASSRNGIRTRTRKQRCLFHGQLRAAGVGFV